jgi:transcriptional regulator GlxA family with amidase domain
MLHGVVTRRFDIEITGSGRVFGVKFRPGGFGAFTGSDVAAWTDRAVPLTEALDAGDLMARVLAADDDDDRVALMDAFLLERRPAPDPTYERLLQIVADMLADRDLASVHTLCERHGVGQRTLQRVFRRYVGVGPKWVLQRFRLQDAQAMLDDGWHGDLSDLAARLGWFDQAHFARDFRDLVGEPPSAYAAGRRSLAGLRDE